MYGINYAATQITQWDFQNKGTLTSPAQLFFVLKVPLRNLRPSIICSVPCDRILQRAYSALDLLIHYLGSAILGVFKRQMSNNRKIDSTLIKINRKMLRGFPKYGKNKGIEAKLVNKTRKISNLKNRPIKVGLPYISTKFPVKHELLLQ